ncbi:hypothetical protein [Streptomyces sp. NPDC088915]|uniref:hypothetical protein n=1 Tax=Streptomyces sp. NPDC088915 TaxID=3365912 RepID=UPI00382FD036
MNPTTTVPAWLRGRLHSALARLRRRSLLTDKDRLLPLLRGMDREALYALAGWCAGEADSRVKDELLGVLRALTTHDTVVRIEFVTTPNYEDGVYWSDETIYLHHEDGTVDPFDFPEEGEAGYEVFAEADERFRDLLAEYSRLDRPVHGAHLIVDLASGDFTESSPYALI